MRTYWTIESLEVEIRKICENLGHFPSASELKFHKRNDLSCQIARRGGFLFWAEKVGYARQHSDSDTGWEGEKLTVEYLESKGFECKLETDSAKRAPHDILVSEVVRVDVKSAKFASYGHSSGWFYRVGKLPQADLIALYQLDTGACYFIPWFASPTTNITITPTGDRYSRFKDNIEIVRSMVTQRQEERNRFRDLITAK